VLWQGQSIFDDRPDRVRSIRAFIYDEQEPPLVTTIDIATSMRQS
jgi:hypothetical protein